MSQELRARLKQRVRKEVGHPDHAGKTVRVEEVTRMGWQFKDGDTVHSLKFEDMDSATVARVLDPIPA